MKSSPRIKPVVTGIGVISSIGVGKADFTAQLLAGSSNFATLSRPGRQFSSSTEQINNDDGSLFIGAELGQIQLPADVDARFARSCSLSSQAALIALSEAWQEARLYDVDPTRIALFVGGSNFQQRELSNIHDRYRGKAAFLKPNYALNFMDTDLCGVCTQHFGIKGSAITIGGASASGQVATIQAAQALQAGSFDVCISLGALMDISAWECQAFRSVGGMGSTRFGAEPELASRPFDRDRDGFIFGESCAAIVLEHPDFAAKRNVNCYAQISGASIVMDANRNPNPSADGEIFVIQDSIRQAGLEAKDIDYVNPHGTGSTVGDITELNALSAAGLNHSAINTTKSVLGHCLTAAGAIELAATILQMNAGKVHPSRNLESPIDDSFNWVREVAETKTIRNAINLSYGFGGINTATCIQLA